MSDHKDPPGTAKECRSCNALIVWTTTSKGKPMPCDVSPSAEGTFYLFRLPDRIDAVHVDGADPRAARAKARGDKRYTSHFATCPNAAQHRKDAKQQKRAEAAARDEDRETYGDDAEHWRG